MSQIKSSKPKRMPVKRAASQKILNREHMIAEAAYYAAENRGDGDDIKSWLQAESEIDKLLASK
jgi:hypothetical protein